MRARDVTVLWILFTVLLFPFSAQAETAEPGAAASEIPGFMTADQEPLEIAEFSQLKRGQKGYGLSVFAGREPVRFEVEVIGVWRTSKPDLPYLMTMLSGQGLEHTGVLGGMSGSPVYFDDKLVGAVAFSFSFAKDPVAGITPISAMRELVEFPGGLGGEAFGLSPEDKLADAPNADKRVLASTRAPIWKPTAADLLSPGGIPTEDIVRWMAAFGQDEESGDRSSPTLSASTAPETITSRERLEAHLRALLGGTSGVGAHSSQGSVSQGPVASWGAPRSSTVWTASGFSGLSRSLLESGLGPALAPRTASAVGGASHRDADLGDADLEDAEFEDLMKVVPAELRGGDAVALQLVGGDLILAAHGTVTDQHGDSIVAYGHPVYSLGPIRLPMAESEVILPIASVESSFKLSNAGRLIGVFDQDREPGAHGRLGVQPDLVPVNVKIEGLAEQTYQMFVADSYMFKPTLLTLCALGSLNAVSHTTGFHGIDVKARFSLEGHEDLVVQQSFDGNQAAVDGAIFILTYAAFLELSESDPASITSVDLEFNQSLEPRLETLTSVRSDRRRVRPGDEVRLRLGIKPYRQEETSRVIPFTIPEDIPEGRYWLMVGDGTSMDAARLAVEPIQAKDMAQSIAMVNQFSSRRSLVVKGLVAAKGLTVDGRALPELPGSMRSVMAYGDGVGATELRWAGEWSEELERPLQGIYRVDLIVER